MLPACGMKEASMEQRRDLQHLQRIAAILDGIPGDTDLPHAIVALEDAIVCCTYALRCGVTLERAREIHRRSITQEETRRLRRGADGHQQ